MSHKKVKTCPVTALAGIIILGLAVSVSNPAIHTILKEHKDKLYLITVNISTEAVDNVQMTIADTGSSKAKVKFENRTASVVNGVITDDFKPNERHVYVSSK